MASLTQNGVTGEVRTAALAVVSVIALGVAAYCAWTLELMLVVPPAIAALTAGAGVVGSIGPRLETRVGRAAAAVAVPVAFACLAFVMITLMMRLMYQGQLHLSVFGLDALGVGTNRFSAPFWLSTASVALLYARDAEVGPARLATTAFQVAVVATAVVIAALYL